MKVSVRQIPSFCSHFRKHPDNTIYEGSENVAVQTQNTMRIQITYQMNTKNKSFLKMHYWLKSRGIKNNRFFLALYDTDLLNIDPRDPRLNTVWKAKVLNECRRNYWYFIREVVRIPDTGGAVGDGVMYNLDRGNLALNFGFTLNWNMFLELPRQFGKTTSALCWYLWVFNFGTTNSEIMFMNKKHDDSKLNLRRLKDLREALPSYLRMESVIDNTGKRLKPTSNVETLSHPINGNKITTKPGANSRAKANGLGRGCTMPMQWYDEYAFILYNKIIYMAATPAFSTASRRAKVNGRPYGILITTTPGDLTTEEGVNANTTRNNATPFNESYYDYSLKELEELRALNTNSNFFYIRFTYQQLGKGDEYFKEMVKDLEKDWSTIKREVLLEWATMSNNSPFTEQELDIVKSLVKKEPIAQIKLGTAWFLDVWKQTDLIRFPPIMGVDVSGGYSQDSSAITIIDSKTTDVLCTFNCNFISTIDLARVIHLIVTRYMPNAVVNVERNGGFGASVLQYLIKTSIKKNLYYEIKDKVIEERYNGFQMAKKSQKVKVYGFDETKNSREMLMEILRDRMTNHKNKFIAKILYDELCTLEIKKNGRIEHADKAHDDQIFSYLMALYVWYEGKDLRDRFGIDIREIRTDDDIDEVLDIQDDLKNYADMSKSINESYSEKNDDEVAAQIRYMTSKKSMSYNEWLDQEYLKDQEALKRLARNPLGAEAIRNAYHTDKYENATSTFIIPPEYFSVDARPETETEKLTKEFNQITNVR